MVSTLEVNARYLVSSSVDNVSLSDGFFTYGHFGPTVTPRLGFDADYMGLLKTFVYRPSQCLASLHILNLSNCSC